VSTFEQGWRSLTNFGVKESLFSVTECYFRTDQTRGDTIIGDISRGVKTRLRLASFCEHFSFVSFIEPKKIDEALLDVDWVNAMHEELNNFTRNQV
jgi:hypothetical protein